MPPRHPAACQSQIEACGHYLLSRVLHVCAPQLPVDHRMQEGLRHSHVGDMHKDGNRSMGVGRPEGAAVGVVVAEGGNADLDEQGGLTHANKCGRNGGDDVSKGKQARLCSRLGL